MYVFSRDSYIGEASTGLEFDENWETPEQGSLISAIPRPIQVILVCYTTLQVFPRPPNVSPASLELFLSKTTIPAGLILFRLSLHYDFLMISPSKLFWWKYWTKMVEIQLEMCLGDKLCLKYLWACLVHRWTTHGCLETSETVLIGSPRIKTSPPCSGVFQFACPCRPQWALWIQLAREKV